MRNWVILFIVFFVADLIPYVVIGETWGLIWFPLNQPVSGVVVESLVGISRDIKLVIGFVSILTAALWTFVIYFCWRIAGMIRRDNKY